MNNIDCSDIENHFNDNNYHLQLYPKFQRTRYITFTYSIFIGIFLKVRNPTKLQ